LQELDVLGTNHFIFWHEGDGAAGLSLEEIFVQVQEVTVAAFTFPRALLVYTFGLIKMLDPLSSGFETEKLNSTSSIRLAESWGYMLLTPCSFS
jgi:hypothetical protein